MTARFVVFVSGNGTNLQAIIDACTSGCLEAEVVAVVSNRATAYGLVRAKEAGIAGLVRPQGELDKARYDSNLADEVDTFEADFVVLAGWNRLLTSNFLNRHRVMNVHPALPGEFPGLKAIERAFQAWQAGQTDRSGVMVHWVPDEGVDDGPTIGSEPVPMIEGDTLESFEARVHSVEHQLLVSCIDTVIHQGASA